jgi:hypothetical protein
LVQRFGYANNRTVRDGQKKIHATGSGVVHVF